MSKTAIYPGTFDPITFGHIDVIKKSLKIVDKLIVATTDNIEKDYLFSLEERIEILNKCLFNDLRLSKNKIKIISFDDLTVKICKKYKASIIIRGLRQNRILRKQIHLNMLKLVLITLKKPQVNVVWK